MRMNEGVKVHYIVVCDFFFFFQAEDGIRDTSVTGVQTCALPISMEYAHRRRAYLDWLEDEPGARSVLIDKPREGPLAAVISARMDLYAPEDVRLAWVALVSSVDRLRSEERRVGKEWCCQWGTRS